MLPGREQGKDWEAYGQGYVKVAEQGEQGEEPLSWPKAGIGQGYSIQFNSLLFV